MITAFYLIVAAIASPSIAYPRGCQGKPQEATVGALYLISNEAVNQVLAIPISNGANGPLSGGTVTNTGGAGANGIDGSVNKPSAPDALFSQGALTVAGQTLFAVNAKDNTVSMMAIDQRDPTKLTLVGQPAPVSGDFPVTVGASAKNNLVCVGTTGLAAGVSCAGFSSAGIGEFDALRPFDLGQSNPPVGPTNTVSHVFFSEDEMSVFATVKGDGKANSTNPGGFAVFAVQQGNCNLAQAAASNAIGQSAAGSRASGSVARTKSSSKRAPIAQAASRKGSTATVVAEQGKLSVPAGSAVLFGSQPIPGEGRVFVTDASFGAGIVSIDGATKDANLTAKVAIDGQKATCWTAISPTSKTAFVTDVGVNRVIEMSIEDASIIATYDLSANGDPGLIDAKAAGNFAFFLSPGNGTTGAAVTVMDVSGGPGRAQMAQHFSLGALGAGKNSMGLAILV